MKRLFAVVLPNGDISMSSEKLKEASFKLRKSTHKRPRHTKRHRKS